MLLSSSDEPAAPILQAGADQTLMLGSENLPVNGQGAAMNVERGGQRPTDTAFR